MAQLFDTGIFSVLTTGSAIGVGWTLGWYVAGTATPIDSYSDPDTTTENTNPVVADAAGRFPQMWLDPGDYKYILKDAAGVTKVTVDDFNVPDAAPDIAAGLESFLAGNAALPIANGGTGQTSAANGIAALGGLPVAGGTMTGPITRSTKGVFLFFETAGMANGNVFLTNSAASDPTSLAGQIWLKYT